jgi:hypothetical protein
VTEHDIPQERDLPAGRLTQLKDGLMTQIHHDLDTGREQPAPVATLTSRRRRRAWLAAAAALVAGFALATPLVLGGNDQASANANTAVRQSDGSIAITLKEAKDPKALQQRLNALGVHATVDFLKSGYGCDPARSTGWQPESRGEEILSVGNEDSEYILHPDQLRSGETVALEFQIDGQGEDMLAVVNAEVSTTPVGPCHPVRNGEIIHGDAPVATGGD